MKSGRSGRGIAGSQPAHRSSQASRLERALSEKDVIVDKQREFRQLLEELISGRSNRRHVMRRAAALGLAGVSLSTLDLAAKAAPGVTSVSLGSRFQEATAAGEPVPGGVLNVGLQADPTTLDPTKAALTAIWKVIEHVYDTLVRVDPSLAPVPGLAESWQISEDGTVYTFALRQGVTFHDGAPFTADDVVFSFTRVLDPANASVNAANFLSVKGAAAFNSGEAAELEGIKAIDDYTVEITLEAPDASFLAILTTAGSVIMSRAFVEANNGDVSQVANGTGPFIFREYVPTTSVSLEKNPSYWEPGLPYLDGIEAVIASDDTARTGALIQGAVDFIEYAPLRDVNTLSETDGLKVAGDELTNIRYLGFNLEREPFNNLQVRQAIAAAIDRQPIIDAAVFGHGVGVDTFFAPSYWAGFDREVPAPDIEKAKSLLADAGYADGFSTTLITYAPYSFMTNTAIIVQEQLNQIGITVDYSALEPATISAALAERDYDMAVAGTNSWVDPHPVLLANFGTGQAGNQTGYSNPEVDALIEQGGIETDLAARAEIYRQLQEILLADLPLVPLFVANQYEAMKTSVQGYQHYPTGSNASFREVWLSGE
jgi:peptide/nickel transport system substrate-binding protein